MTDSGRFLLKREYIVENIRKAIASGEFRPGQKLRQEELAARFQISSTPVREALRQLEAEGLVTSVAHQGVIVAQLSPEEINERYRLRALLEAYAAKEAVNRLQNEPERRSLLLSQLKDIQVRMQTALEAENWQAVVELNNDLHLRFYEEAKSPLLKQMIVDLWKYQFPFSTLWIVPGRAEKALTEHEGLFAAIERGDAEAAERITREHIDHSSQMLLEYLDKDNE